MSSATIRSARTSAGRDQASASPWVARGITLAALALAALAIAWLAGWVRFGTDPRVREILALQEQARERYAQGGGPENLADATAAVTSMMEIRQKVEQLPEHLRPQVERSAGNVFRSAFRARIDSYFALPPAERQAELDRQIDQDEMMRKAYEAGRAVMSALGGGQAAAGSPPTTAQQPARTPWASRSEEERNRWRKSMLDRTSPQDRARYTEYRRAVDARREQRGLPNQWSH
jgi:hypothetical protein